MFLHSPPPAFLSRSLAKPIKNGRLGLDNWRPSVSSECLAGNHATDSKRRAVACCPSTAPLGVTNEQVEEETRPQQFVRQPL